MTRDEYGRRLITEDDICAILYKDPCYDVCRLNLDDPTQHDSALAANHSELCRIQELAELDIDPLSWHAQNQETWHMPDSYRDMDIAAWILSRCDCEEELQRCGQELLQYAERGLMPLLAYLKYLVDTMIENGIVWGIGRGSSVASFVLYKIGVHRINSIEHELDFAEFMR